MSTAPIKAGRAYIELFVSQSRFAQGLRSAQASLNAFGSKMRATFAGLGKAAQQSFSQMAKYGKQAMTGIAVAGAGAAAAMGASTRVFAGFEQRMARVKALTQSTEPEFQSLATLARKLGADTVYSAEQAAEAMGNFAQAGFSVNEILAATPHALNLAATGQIEIGQAADITAKLMRGMGIASQDVGAAVDVLAKAMSTSNTDLIMLGDAFKFVGPIAHATGTSFHEITAAIQLLSNAGVQGEMAGTSLRGMILTLQTPSKEGAEMLDKLGVSVNDASGNMRPFADIVGDLEKGLSGLGSGAKIGALGKIFPDRQAAGAAELVLQGADALRQATGALKNSAGFAKQVADIQLDTLSGDVEVLKSATEELAISFAETFQQELRASIRGVSEMVNGVGKWIVNNKQMIGEVANTARKVALFAVGLYAAAKAAGVIAAAVMVIANPVGLVAVAVAGLTAAWLTCTEDGQKAMADLSAFAGRLQADMAAAFGGITDSIAAGDMALATKIATDQMAIYWQELKAATDEVGIGIKDIFVRLAMEGPFQFAQVIIDSVAVIKTAMTDATEFIYRQWMNMFVGIQSFMIDLDAQFRAMVKRLDRFRNGTDGSGAADAILFAAEEKKKTLRGDNQKFFDQNAASGNQSREDIERERKLKTRGLGMQRQQFDEGRFKEASADRQSDIDKIEAMKAQLAASIQAAKAARAAVPFGDFSGVSGNPGSPGAAAVSGGLSEMDSQIAATKGSGKGVQGSFSGNAAAFATTSPAEKTAKELKEIRELAKEQLKEARKAARLYEQFVALQGRL